MKMSHIFFFKLQRSIHIVLHDADIYWQIIIPLYYIVGTKISLHLFEYILQAIKSHKLNQNNRNKRIVVHKLYCFKENYFVSKFYKIVSIEY